MGENECGGMKAYIDFDKISIGLTNLQMPLLFSALSWEGL